ncbi:hypothetical protein [Allocoleopsis sp.]|uniref:hypothetical protein n=1 Tax=Allocoleopsis sp. TaxID=3088169 RepID=UPI002FD02DC9
MSLPCSVKQDPNNDSISDVVKRYGSSYRAHCSEILAKDAHLGGYSLGGFCSPDVRSR